MKYLLIDTCSWINLLSYESENKLLNQLVFWEKTKEITIITHQIVIKEWDEHKEKRRKEFQDSLNTKYKHANEINKKENVPLLGSLKPNLNSINTQIETIDTILNKEAIILNTSDKIKAYSADRSIAPKKAPFHNKTDSTKDAYIIFSALDYLKNEKIIDITFISDNKDDFGAKDDLERKIHPQIIEDYPEVKVDYYRDIGRCIHELKQTLTAIQEADHSDSEDLTDTEDIVDKSQSILTQIHSYLKYRYENINFIPIHLLTRSYPFKKNSNYTPYHSYFTLTTDNADLYNLFNSIEVIENKEIKIIDTTIIEDTNESKEKIEYVLKQLTTNLIFNIESHELHQAKHIFFRNEMVCDCFRCKYFRFQFAEAFDEFKNDISDLDELLKLAYVQYQSGNYILAYATYKKIISASKNSHKNTAYFIAQYNLSKLVVFIRNHYWGKNDESEKIAELKNIKLDEQFSLVSKDKNNKVFEWLKSNSFYSESRDQIHSTVQKIIDHYYSQLNGGWSSNNHSWELISAFAQIDHFLNFNFIIYDRFSEFSDLFEMVTEGLIASHAIDKSQHSRLKSFDDFLITKLIYYGKADAIVKYIGRYNLKHIEYTSTSKEGDKLLELLDNFLSGYQKTIESFEKNCETNNRNFWDKYNSIFNNLLVISGLIDLEKDIVNDITKKLLGFLQVENKLHFQKFKWIKFFLSRHSKKMDKKLADEFLKFAIENGKYHDESIFETVAYMLSESGNTGLDDETLNALITIFSEKCTKCNREHNATPLTYFYKGLSTSNKNKITTTINNILSKKYNSDLFYMASIFNIFGVDTTYFDDFITTCIPNAKQKSFREVFSGETEEHNSRIDMLINLAYKYNVDLSEKRFDSFRNISPYYDWLLNLSGYDYKNFQPKWVTEYSTKYYLDKFKTIPELKETLIIYLKENRDSKIEREYIDIVLK